MKTSAFRWIAVAVMLCAMALLISSPALAETASSDLAATASLPLDQTVPGYPAQESGWTAIPAAEAVKGQKVLRYASKTRTWFVTDSNATVSEYDSVRYKDPTITEETSFMTVYPAYKPGRVPAAVVRMKDDCCGLAPDERRSKAVFDAAAQKQATTPSACRRFFHHECTRL